MENADRFLIRQCQVIFKTKFSYEAVRVNRHSAKFN
jgi:hypothetical protein